jgi:hypothetical protein
MNARGVLELKVGRDGVNAPAQHVSNASALRGALFGFFLAFREHVLAARGGLSLLCWTTFRSCPTTTTASDLRAGSPPPQWLGRICSSLPMIVDSPSTISFYQDKNISYRTKTIENKR